MGGSSNWASQIPKRPIPIQKVCSKWAPSEFWRRPKGSELADHPAAIDVDVDADADVDVDIGIDTGTYSDFTVTRTYTCTCTFTVTCTLTCAYTCTSRCTRTSSTSYLYHLPPPFTANAMPHICTVFHSLSRLSLSCCTTGIGRTLHVSQMS